MKTLLTIILLLACLGVNGQEIINLPNGYSAKIFNNHYFDMGDFGVYDNGVDPTAFYDGYEWHTSGISPKDSLICVERGHVLTGTCTQTLAWCPPYTIDYADSTVTVFPNCNTSTCVCARCGQVITTGGKEFRITTWRRTNIK